MKLKGTQLYWLIFAGLVLPFIFAPLASEFSIGENKVLLLISPFLICATICQWYVLLEIRDRIGVEGMALGIFILAVIWFVHARIALFLALAVLPLYWLSRINGIEAKK